VKIFATIVLTAAFVGVGVHAQRVASERQKTAQAWSGDRMQFAAVGLTGSTLHIVFPDESQVECDAMVDSITSDSKMLRDLRLVGFRRVECGQVRGDLR
jgi:hypothetical protein